MAEWDVLIAELTNKFRWSLGTATAGHFNISYREQLKLASMLAGDAITLLKMKEERPDLQFDRSQLRPAAHTSDKSKTKAGVDKN